MARLVWSPQAADDLEATCIYISRDSQVYAQEFARRIVSSVELLARFPEAGRIVPEFSDRNLRELVSGHYRVIYELRSNDVVAVLAIHHGSRPLGKRPTE